MFQSYAARAAAVAGRGMRPDPVGIVAVARIASAAATGSCRTDHNARSRRLDQLDGHREGVVTTARRGPCYSTILVGQVLVGRS